MTRRHPMARVLIAFSLVCIAPVAARAQDDCQSIASNYDFAGWQAPGLTGGGTWVCNANSGYPIFQASPDAYTGALRRTPEEAANLEVRLIFSVFSPDGTDEDAFSLLLHWRDPVLPAGCCEPIHGSGLRVLFSVARSRMEVYQETAGTSGGPVATLPMVLTGTGIQDVLVAYRGPLLTVTHYGHFTRTVEVPITPPGRIGFDFRRIQAVFVPTITVDCTAPGDYDCDGVADAQDVCPQNADPGQEDFDGDGRGNACSLDDDADGVPDESDLCPFASNPDQSDADGDRLGDACDACPTDPSNDIDADGICGASDNCPAITNADQSDFDADGQGDFCDANDGRITLSWSDASHLRWQRDYGLSHIYRGDLDVLRSTGVYVTDPLFPGPLDLRSCSREGQLWVETETPPPGKGMFFHVSGSSNGVESGLGPDSEGTERPNDYACLAGCDQPFTIFYGYSSPSDGPGTQGYLVIDNRADWCAFWPPACGSAGIDFETETAVVLSTPLWDTCYDEQISCMRRDQATGGVIVETQQTIAGPRCGCLAVVFYRVIAAKIPRPGGPVTFVQNSAPLICP